MTALRTLPLTAMLLLLTGSMTRAAVAGGIEDLVVEDPHFGEVLFYFYQQDHFTALTHLATARSQQRTPNHELEAELLQGGLMLSWGQHEEAGRIFERLLDSTDDQEIRDRTWFYLAKVRYQRGHLAQAEQAFLSIQGTLPEELEAERRNLLSRLYIDQGRFADAVALLQDWDTSDAWSAYARFNTGVALVRMGQLGEGARLLEGVGTMRAATEELRSLRDRANVALGFAYLQAELDGNARPVLERVRLNGPFSNKALLGVGWADSAENRFEAALAVWLELSQRDLLDSAVQESLLAVPYAYTQLGAEPLAAGHYNRALDIYSVELSRLDGALNDAREGRLLPALLADDSDSMGTWYWRLGALPDAEQSRYLYFTIADHRFHEGLKSYRDLRALQAHLAEWQDKLVAYRDMIATREFAYSERLPALESRIARFDLADLQQRHADIVARTETAIAEHDVVAFADESERAQWERLVRMEESPAWTAANAAEQRDKQRILKGVLQWNLDREFRVRAWRQQRANAELDEQLAAAVAAFESVDQATGSLADNVEGFAARIDRLEPQIDRLQQRLAAAMAQYERYLNRLAADELVAQRERLLTYRAQARFALASIYDRMAAENR